MPTRARSSASLDRSARSPCQMAYPLTAAISAQQITPSPATRTSTAGGAERERRQAERDGDAEGRLQRPVEQALLAALGRRPVGVEPFLRGRRGTARRRPGLRVRSRVLPAQAQAGPGDVMRLPGAPRCGDGLPPAAGVPWPAPGARAGRAGAGASPPGGIRRPAARPGPRSEVRRGGIPLPAAGSGATAASRAAMAVSWVRCATTTLTRSARSAATCADVVAASTGRPVSRPRAISSATGGRGSAAHSASQMIPSPSTPIPSSAAPAASRSWQTSRVSMAQLSAGRGPPSRKSTTARSATVAAEVDVRRLAVRGRAQPAAERRRAEVPQLPARPRRWWQARR